MFRVFTKLLVKPSIPNEASGASSRPQVLQGAFHAAWTNLPTGDFLTKTGFGVDGCGTGGRFSKGGKVYGLFLVEFWKVFFKVEIL